MPLRITLSNRVIGPVLTTAVVVADDVDVVAGVVLLTPPPPPPAPQPESIALRPMARSISKICGLEHVRAINIVLIILFFLCIYNNSVYLLIRAASKTCKLGRVPVQCG